MEEKYLDKPRIRILLGFMEIEGLK